MSQSYKYFAFISYSRKDSRAAAWLQKRLEWFRFPVKLVPEDRRPPNDRYIRPIYRDKTNLEVTDEHYWTNIRRALEESRYLIVLCSPHSAKSKPVDMEVSHFLASHEQENNRVVPIILSGHVTSEGDDAALGPTLRALAETITSRNLPTMVSDSDTTEQDAWEQGFIGLAAYLLKLEPSAIGDHIQRETKRQAKVLRRWLAAVIVLAATSLVGGIIAYEQKRTADAQTMRAVEAEKATQAQLVETNRQLERSQVEEGRTWLERGKAALNRGDHLSALMLAGRAIGYQGYGRLAREERSFSDAFPQLLAKPMSDPTAEKERSAEASEVTRFLGSVRPTHIPLWESAMANVSTCVAFSPDGTRLACGSFDRIKLWDTATGKELATLKGHTRPVRSVAFSPDGTRLASGSNDSTIKLWDAASGKELATLQKHIDAVLSLAFSPDGTRLASGGQWDTVTLWDATTGKELGIPPFKGHSSSVTSISFSPDGSRFASTSDNKTIIWDTASHEELTTLQGHTGSVYSIAFSPDGTRLASAGQRDTIIWDAVTGKELASLKGHTDSVYSIAFSPHGTRLASGSRDKTIKLWDAASGKELATLQGHTYAVLSVAFSPDGSRLASSSDDNTIKLWDVAPGKELASLQGHTDAVRGVAFSPDGSCLASGSDDTTLKLWDAASGKELASLQGHTAFVGRVAFSPDGSRLASGSWDTTLKQWDAVSGKELASATPGDLATAKQWIAAAAQSLSPDQKRKAEIEGKTVFIVPNPPPTIDLAAPLRAGLLALPGRDLQFLEIKQTTPMLHVRQDTLAQLADSKLTPDRYAELRMKLCTKSSQFRAATALWRRLLQGEWLGFENTTVPKDQAPASIPADSPIRRLYLLALIDATKHPQIHGHPTICQTAAQIAPVLTKEMMATPTISLAMMSLMQTLAKDESPEMTNPREALMKRLEEVATAEWLAVLREKA